LGEIFRSSKPALGPTQPPVQWVPFLSSGVKYGRGVLLTTHTLLVPRSWKSRAIPLPTLWATTEPVTGTLYLYPFYFVFGVCVGCCFRYRPGRFVRHRIPLMVNVLKLDYVFKINFIIVSMQILRRTDCSKFTNMTSNNSSVSTL